MASVDEVSSAVSAAVSKSDETDAAIGAAASSADELTSTLQAAGVDDRATMSEEARGKLDEAAAQQAAAKQSLEAALGILNGIKGLAARAPDATIPSNRPTPLDAAPAHLREPTAKVGDPVKPGPVAPNPYRQELSGNDDGERKFGRSRRLGRAVVRNASDLKDQAKQTFTVSVGQAGDFEPTETVGVPRPDDPVMSSSAPQAHAPDIVSEGVLIAAFAVEGISRLKRRRRNRDK